MTAQATCPCCGRLWQPPAESRLPIWRLKPLAFAFVREKLGVSEIELKSRRRAACLVEGRALFVWIAKTFGPDDLWGTTIGRWIEKDHSSIIHMRDEIIPRLQKHDPDFALLCGEFAEWASQQPETLQ